MISFYNLIKERSILSTRVSVNEISKECEDIKTETLNTNDVVVGEKRLILLRKNPKLEKLEEELKKSLKEIPIIDYEYRFKEELIFIDEIVKELKLIWSMRRKKCGFIHNNRYIVGRYLNILRETLKRINICKQKKISFKRLLERKEIEISETYTYFLMRYSKLIDKYPRLKKSNKGIYWFTENITNIVRICRKDKVFWGSYD